ncbi:MAG: TonB family protein [Deltaproteobacteria bacterium]|nr:TonB family protein [Deltaproteobacteria bacterium]
MSRTWENAERFDSDGMRWSPVVIVSVLLHAAVFSLMFLVPDSFSIRRPARPGTVYEVRLVEMPGEPGGAKETVAAKQQATPPKKEPQKAGPVPAPKPAKRIAEVQREKKPVVVAKKTVRKDTTPVKKREVSPSEAIERAISKIDRKVQSEKTPPPSPPPKTGGSHLERALADIQSRAEGQPGTGAGRAGAGGVVGTVLQIYKATITQWIAGNWSYPAALQPEGNPEATVLLEVRRDGTITSSRFVKRSSNAVFDESVLRAVERSNPLPPFPEAYSKSRDEIEIRFNLEELQQG